MPSTVSRPVCMVLDSSMVMTPSLPTTLTASAFQRRAHHIDVADTFERIVDAAVGQIDDNLLHRPIVFFRIEAIGSSERPGHGKLICIGVDRDDAAGLGHHGTLYDREPDAT